MSLAEGTKIEQFETVELLGKGGMGEVYLARDTKLRRNVAIKILTDALSADAEQLKRFVQEAQAASALNHPNIVTVYDIGEFQGSNYIALEYIDGRSLTEHLSSRSLSLFEALKIAVQLASALDSAHSAGIIHRDIKPDNVMVREDGIVKILDFGIAKLTEKPHREPGPEDRTELKVNTSPGMILGTASYMSPEQGKGGAVDSRSDIFSLGIVIYEMVSGRLPFEGESAMEMIGSILKDEPAALPEGLAPDLRRIVSKCLRKDPDERYQTMKGLLADLKQLREEVPEGATIDPASKPTVSEQQTRMIEATTSERPDESTQLTSQTRRFPWIYAVAAALIAAVSGAVVFNFFPFWKSAPQAFTRVGVEEIRTGSLLGEPVISPDSRFVAFPLIADGDGGNELLVRQLETGEETSIYKTRADLRLYSYSPDGQYLYFPEARVAPQSTLYRISSIGGTPKKLAEGRSLVAVRPSPDGKALVFREIVEGKGAVAFVFDLASGEKMEVLGLSDIDAVDFLVGGWTPDSEKLLLLLFPEIQEGGESAAGGRAQLAIYDPNENGKSRKERIEIFHDQRWDDFSSQLTFLPDYSGVIALARPFGGRFQFYRISYPAGEAVQITNDSSRYSSLSLDADGSKFVTATVVDISSLWSYEPQTGKSRQISAESKSRRSFHFSRTAEGRLFYIDDSGTTSKVVSIDSEGQNQEDHFSNPTLIGTARVAPDGRYVVAGIWTGEVGGERLYRFDLDGNNKTQLTGVKNGGDYTFTISNDGEIIFGRTFFAVSAPSKLYSVPLEGGEEKPVEGLEESRGDFNPSVSPDGRYLAYESQLKSEGSEQLKNVVRVVEYADGRAGKKVLEYEWNPPRIRWWHDSSALILEDEYDAYGNFIKVTVPGGVRSRLTDFQVRADSGDLVWSVDNDRLIIMRVTTITGLVMISDAGKTTE